LVIDEDGEKVEKEKDWVERPFGKDRQIAKSFDFWTTFLP
jgi:hypothetical protein